MASNAKTDMMYPSCGEIAMDLSKANLKMIRFSAGGTVIFFSSKEIPFPFIAMSTSYFEPLCPVYRPIPQNTLVRSECDFVGALLYAATRRTLTTRPQRFGALGGAIH